ncbi:MurR/RpiR family transcriptional regulator [uncultured Aliiroseovarius sp.]|uniref:MurR/RpiR family transcriptional regulator n=1 Tax=uncultured Aliiroseovarius sp. TaxID=1658783 RepID=UPI0026106AFA|nr:MurR/RpiR family transcriptional regulator [uncultured Aliiroseovarius sp.]
MKKSFEKRLALAYADLSGALKGAADFLVANPLDVVTRPLRTVSRNSGVSPAAFSRLAKALGYEDFEALREEMRDKIDRRVNNFATRAEQLQKQHEYGADRFVDLHLDACQSNLRQTVAALDHAELERTVEELAGARKVLLLGALGSTGVIEYLSYMANFCADNWVLANRMGASLGGALTGLDQRDVLLIVTKPPFASNVIKAAKLAQQLDVFVVVITDSHMCPALEFASAAFVVPTESPQFFSSYVATLFLIETIIGMVVGRSGALAQERIAEVELRNRQMAEVWSE